MRKKTINTRTPRNVKNRRTSAAKRAASLRPSRLGSFFLPLFLSFCLLICLTAIGMLGYQSVTASTFFDVKAVDVRGVERSSKDDIKRIVESSAEKSGVWNADLLEIKARVEKMAFVKSAAVSRVLPNGIRVNVVERVPTAIVRLSNGDFLVDNEGNVLAPAAPKEENLPVTMIGWDELKTEKAFRDNLERIKMYQKMMAEWSDFDLTSRVTSVNLADLREPRAITQDSGMAVSIALGKEAFGDHLRKGIGAIVGKGEMFDAVNLVGQNMILSSRKTEGVGRQVAQ
ncbi:MAG: FtsQ-type POTRA domain-containing protein [Pyrinomonadaceae bacterium]